LRTEVQWYAGCAGVLKFFFADIFRVRSGGYNVPVTGPACTSLSGEIGWYLEASEPSTVNIEGGHKKEL